MDGEPSTSKAIIKMRAFIQNTTLNNMCIQTIRMSFRFLVIIATVVRIIGYLVGYVFIVDFFTDILIEYPTEVWEHSLLLRYSRLIFGLLLTIPYGVINQQIVFRLLFSMLCISSIVNILILISLPPPSRTHGTIYLFIIFMLHHCSIIVLRRVR